MVVCLWPHFLAHPVAFLGAFVRLNNNYVSLIPDAL